MPQYRGRGLVLPQPDFIDSPREALPPLRSGQEWDGGRWEGLEKRREGELGLVCKMKKVLIN